MKKIAGLFLLMMVLAGRVIAQDGASPTAVVSAQSTPGAAAPGAVPAAQPTTQSAPGMPLVYFSMGTGSALIGNGFGTEGNPWNDTIDATLANGFGVNYNPSLAFTGLIGFNLNPNWSVNLSFETYSFAGSQSGVSNEENIIPSLRYTFDFGPVSPFVTAGYGFNINTTSVAASATILNTDPTGQSLYNTQAVSNMVASGGVGLLFKVAGDWAGHAYLEAQFQQVFTTQGSFSYYPLIIGYQYP